MEALSTLATSKRAVDYEYDEGITYGTKASLTIKPADYGEEEDYNDYNNDYEEDNDYDEDNGYEEERELYSRSTSPDYEDYDEGTKCILKHAYNLLL